MTFPQVVRRPPRALVGALVLGLVGPAGAFHRHTPALTVITTGGDTDLPHLPSQGRRLFALVEGSEIVTYSPYSTAGLGTPLAPGSAPGVSFTGRTIAFEANPDPFARGLPGQQIVLSQDGELIPGPPDPSGTSANPSLDKRGTTLAFESRGDLTNVGTPGDLIDRVYAYSREVLTLVSRGSGTSGNAMLSAKRGLIAFESTSDPVTGADTGVTQVWLGAGDGRPAQPITAGAASSSDPSMSDDGRLVAFTSRAALATDGMDTGVSQVFVYDSKSETYAQVTDDPGGCGRPAVSKVRKDWRIAFVCGDQAYFQMLRQNQRYHVPTPDGSTQAIIPDMGSYFVTISTTADLASGSGTTAGHQIYVWNLFRAPPPTAPGSVTWFPFQGIPGL